MKTPQEIKDEVGWLVALCMVKDPYTKLDYPVHDVRQHIMNLCKYVKTLEQRIIDLESEVEIATSEKEVMSSVELYKDAGR